MKFKKPIILYNFHRRIYSCRETVFDEWNFQINESKTEFVDFGIAGKDELKDDGTPLRGSKEWFSSTTAGFMT